MGDAFRRQLLRVGGAALLTGLAGCVGGFDSGDGENDIQDTDGDGVIDSEDYAPRDPEIQQEEQLNEDTSTATETSASDEDSDTREIRSIALGETIESEISSDDGTDPEYGDLAEPVSITIEQRQTVRIQMDSNQFDPFVVIADKIGNTVTEIDDGGGNYNADDVVVLEPGTYVIWAGSLSGGEMGSYALRAGEVRSIALGETIESEISSDDGTDPEYGDLAEPASITIEQRQTVRIQMDSNQFDPFVVVADATGYTIAEMDDGGGNYNTDDTVVLESGTYTIWASSLSGSETGFYRLSVSGNGY